MRQQFQLIPAFFLLTISFQLLAQESRSSQIDTAAYSYRTVKILGKEHSGFLTPDGFQLLNSKDEIYLRYSGEYFTWEFKDFNKDGYNDIYLEKSGDTPERFDLLLYVPAIKSFKSVKDFENFPSPENISGTKYFYSYHKSGCADMNWDSDLFYIKDFRATRLASVSGRECGDGGIKDGLYIYRVKREKKNLIKKLPIDTIHKFPDDKWGFIKKYWTENYKLFL